MQRYISTCCRLCGARHVNIEEPTLNRDGLIVLGSLHRGLVGGGGAAAECLCPWRPVPATYLSAEGTIDGQ